MYRSALSVAVFGALVAAGLALPSPVSAMPASGLTQPVAGVEVEQVAVKKKRRHARIHVTGPRYGYGYERVPGPAVYGYRSRRGVDPLTGRGYGPYSTGYYDQGYAYHGNMNGCVVDLGYGRFESCNGRY